MVTMMRQRISYPSTGTPLCSSQPQNEQKEHTNVQKTKRMIDQQTFTLPTLHRNWKMAALPNDNWRGIAHRASQDDLWLPRNQTYVLWFLRCPSRPLTRSHRPLRDDKPPLTTRVTSSQLIQSCSILPSPLPEHWDLAPYEDMSTVSSTMHLVKRLTRSNGWPHIQSISNKKSPATSQ